MEIPPFLLSFIAKDPSCTREVAPQNKELEYLLLGTQENHVPDFPSLEEIRHLLCTRNYQVLAQVSIPPLLEYYKLVIDYYSLEWVKKVPLALRLEVCSYALVKYREFGIPIPLKKRFPALQGVVEKEATSILHYLTTAIDLSELYKRYPSSYNLISCYPNLYFRLLSQRLKSLPQASVIRAFHINPFHSPQKIEKELESVVVRLCLVGRDSLIEEMRETLLQYWIGVASVEFGEEVTSITNHENTLLENILDYGVFDSVPLLEDKCLYVLTVHEFVDTIDKKRNPWTGRSLTPEIVSRLTAKVQMMKDQKMPLEVYPFSEMIDEMLALHLPLQVMSSPLKIHHSVIHQLSTLLSEYYITEEGLQRLQDIHVPNLTRSLMRASIYFLPKRTMKLFLGQVLTMILEHRDVTASIAMALMESIQEV
ncbi:MAG: hypothetical protein WC208_14315 [Gallionella sp.]|jgi:hypothetical protein